MTRLGLDEDMRDRNGGTMEMNVNTLQVLFRCRNAIKDMKCRIKVILDELGVKWRDYDKAAEVDQLLEELGGTDW